MNTNNKKLFKKESLKKIEEFLFMPTPHKKSKSRESSLFNFNTAKKENLISNNGNIEVIAEEENNEFLITGMKFNSQKKLVKDYSPNCNDETENEKSATKKKMEENNLPPLLKKSSSIFTQNLRSNLLFGKIESKNNDFNTPEGKIFH